MSSKFSHKRVQVLRSYVGARFTFAIAYVHLFCVIQTAHAADSVPTFSRDIFPLFQKKCHECHRPDTIAPMSLLTYEQARPWANAIRTEVAAKRMPPFHADGPIGYYKEDGRLTDREINTVLAWVDGGTPQGNPADMPAPKEWKAPAWPLGEPDLTINFPSVTPKTGSNEDWWTLYSDYVFPEDTWIRGATLRIDEHSAIHHAQVFIIEPLKEIPAGGKENEVQQTLTAPLETWFPGHKPSLLPDRLGEFILKGSRVAIQVHFGPTVDGKSESPAIGVYLATGTVETTLAILSGRGGAIDIPPNDPEYIVRSEDVFKVSGTITHFQSHMHLRGKSSQIFLHYPDGRSELVFDLPRFDFDWQRYYYLAQPKWVPAGTVAEFIGIWDNSADNPHNPDPTQRVHRGRSTTDEMFGLHIYYTPDLKLYKTFAVKDGRVTDSQDNADTGPWVLFWKNIVDREWLADKLKDHPELVSPGDAPSAP